MKISHLTHLVLMVVLLVVAIGMYTAWHMHVEKESATAVALAGQIQNASQEAIQLEAQKDTLEKISSDETMIQDYFVDPADIVTFLESLQKTGESLGTTVDVVSVAAEKSKVQNYLNLSLHITGPFDSVMRTLGALEYSPYDISVTSLTLDTTGGTNGVASEWTAATTFRVGTKTHAKVAASTKNSTQSTSTPATTASIASSTTSTQKLATSTATTTP